MTLCFTYYSFNIAINIISPPWAKQTSVGVVLVPADGGSALA